MNFQKWALPLLALLVVTCGRVLPEPTLAGNGYLGVGFDLEDRPNVLERCPKGAGIRLTSVAEDGPAEQAGLTNSHVITSVDEVTFSTNRTWANFSETIRRYGPGDQVRVRGLIVMELRTRDGRPVDDRLEQKALKDVFKSAANIELKQVQKIEPFEMVVTLGGRPSLMDTDPIELPETGRYGKPALAAGCLESMRAVSEDAVDDIWTALRDRWARNENEDLLGILDVVRYLHLCPLQLEPATAGWSSQLLAGEGPEVAAHILDCDLTALTPLQPVANEPDLVLKQIETFLDELEVNRLKALGSAAASFDVVRTELVNLAGHFNTHIYLSEYEPKSGQAAIRSSLATADTVDIAPLIDNLRRTQEFFAPDRSRHMLEVLKARWGSTIVLGNWTLLLGTSGRDRLRGRPTVVMDPGGDDIYQILPGSTGIVAGIDLGGNDTVTVNGDFGPASTCGGSSWWCDVSGNDTYRAGRMAFGFACIGAALMEDRQGQDRYLIGNMGCGMALYGYAEIRDLTGDDVYVADLAAQGSAWIKSAAFAVDNAGDDTWTCSLGRGSSYGTDQIFRGHGQGSGYGLRGIAGGGIGALVDGGGEDSYTAGNFSQGCGYAQASGFLMDRGAGDDAYHGSRYCQAASAHGATGLLDDDGGNDRYSGLQGSLQGGGWDLSTAIFIDRAGNDHHLGGKFFSHGASAHNGFSVFVDVQGDDHYGPCEGYGRAMPNNYHGGPSLSCFLDQNGRDTYAKKDIRDGSRFYGGHLGFFEDRGTEFGPWLWSPEMNGTLPAND